MHKLRNNSIRFTVLSRVEQLEIWVPVVRNDVLNLGTDAEKIARCQYVEPDVGRNVSVDASKLAVGKSVVLGDECNLGVNAKELVRCKLVSPEDGFTFNVDTDVLAS